MTAPGDEPMPTDRIPILIDCDTGIDDSLALLYACASPEADILAVTCCSGNVHATDVARNTLAVLELAGRGDIEVAIGRTTPLIRPLEITTETHGPQGIGHAELPPPKRAVSDRHGVDVIIETARRRPGEVTLVTLGPLTNLATALLREPELPHLLRRWVLMGGCFRVAGNTTPREEWNIHCDPDAARIAFAAFATANPNLLPIALGLDVTEQSPFVPDDLVALARRAGSLPDDSLALARGEDPMHTSRSVASNPIVRYLADALRFYMEFHARYDGFYGAHIHDALALATALDPSLVQTETVTVDVETEGRLTTGETVADFRHRWGRPPNCEVAVSVDSAAFRDRFIERVGNLAARMAVEAR
jgi:purine nucleosidase